MPWDLPGISVPRGDGANLEPRRATVTQIRGLDVATLRPFGRSQSWRATVTQIRALEVATLRPFGRSISWRATVTQISGLLIVQFML